jgi:deazaflavin-dependent oxidoreductase (nitroreductase family)
MVACCRKVAFRALIVAVALIAASLAISFTPLQEPLIRRFYRGGKPTRLARRLNGAWSFLVSAGIAPPRWPGAPVSGPVTVEVRGRKTGKPHSTMATWVEYDGSRYLVSMLGEDSDWVRNVQAADAAAILRRGVRRPVRLDMLPVAERAPVIREWYQRTWRSTRPHLGVDPKAPLAEFERIAPRYPVFRITPAA